LTWADYPPAEGTRDGHRYREDFALSPTGQYIRLIADGMVNPEARETLLQIAGNFESLAHNIEMDLGVLPPERNSGSIK
jgi:hypothetical protein